ncbi:MAG: hypothetical protein CBD27_02250 [Rhodospirillaceae bacterium TMED167]|nr:hypothetical protein [Rhodospirillaceae bacterium]OUW30026.1 MAG: hypothetical protein CBD27_02250 [Rhodospirillaceae bacterium TMED167]
MRSSKVSLLDGTTCWQDTSAKSIGYFSRLDMTKIDQSLLAELERMAQETGENVRLSLHSGPTDDFHEMIICQHRNKIHPPKKHQQKAKSFHVMKGQMAVYAFSDDGLVQDAALLDGTHAHLYRVEQGVYHADFPVTDLVIHHESTLGPFLGDDDAIHAPWAKAFEGDMGLLTYRDQLIAQLPASETKT